MPALPRLLRSCWGIFVLFWTVFLNTTLVDVVGSEQQIPLSVVKLWASAFGGEIKSIAAKYSGSQLLQKLFIAFVLTSYFCMALYRLMQRDGDGFVWY